MNNSVVAIPPSYDVNENLEVDSTINYVKYLVDSDATHVMTTAGTSQFNLLSIDEIHKFNESVSLFTGNKILGIPQVSNKYASEFSKNAKKYIDNKTKLMALYPDRYYNDEIIIGYIKDICNSIGDSIYVHAQKMRHGISGDWDYASDTINSLFESGYLCGIKEEHSNLKQSYNFVKKLNKDLHIIVAGGSMRRYQFLESAGANSLLAGIGNITPQLENEFLKSDIKRRNEILDIESKVFFVFMSNGWHKSLRETLRILNLTCFYDRQPWPKTDEIFSKKIRDVLKELQNEK